MTKYKTRYYAAIAGLTIGLAGCGPADKTLWISDDDGDLGYVNLDTGAVTLVGNMGVTMTDIAFDSAGNLWGITFTDLYSINKVTGEPSLIGPHNNDSGAKNSLVFDKNGTLYAAWDALYTVDTTTGMSNLIGNGGTSYRSSGDLALFNGQLYMSSRDLDGIGDELVTLDTLDGAASVVGALGETPTFYGLSANAETLYTVNGTTVYSVDSATAVVTEVLDYTESELGLAYGTAFETEAE